MEAFKIGIYILCFVTSGICAGLLWRGYLRSAARLLLWSALCFGFLAGNNLSVMLDIVIFPDIDLQMLRHGLALAAICTLLFGLVWESE